VLLIASEAEPFIKTGGLGDVLGAFPQELGRRGIEARVILPKYGGIPDHFKRRMISRATLTVRLGWRNQLCTIEQLDHQGIVFYFVSQDEYFNRQGLYGFADDGERFSFFSRAVLEALPHLDFAPDVLHCHDWQSALVPVFLKAYQGYVRVPTVFTIHNLKYQGVFPARILGDYLELGAEYFTMDGLEFFGQVNFLKGGLVYADLVSTVSKTYAQEIRTREFGEQLDGILRKIGDKLWGIRNGLDYTVYNPETDPNIFLPYNHKTWEKKQNNKTALQKSLGLSEQRDIPLLGLICRLVPQKGLDLMEEVFDPIMDLGVQLVVLGTGEEKYHQLFRSAALRYPGRVSVHLGFDDALAHRIYAGSDIFLMPSIFEPCGLGQMIALRYGSVPVVRATGGLKDTVQPFNRVSKEGNGFVFAGYQAQDLLHTIEEAVRYYHDQEIWGSLVKNAMSTDCSWQSSMGEYHDLYQKLVLK